jgi:hypothetical protein
LEEALEGDLKQSLSDVSPALSQMKDVIKKKAHSRDTKKDKDQKR